MNATTSNLRAEFRSNCCAMAMYKNMYKDMCKDMCKCMRMCAGQEFVMF